MLNDFRQKILKEILPYISREIKMAKCVREELNVVMQNCRGCKMITNRNVKGLSDVLPTDIVKHISTFVCCKTCLKTRKVLDECEEIMDIMGHKCRNIKLTKMDENILIFTKIHRFPTQTHGEKYVWKYFDLTYDDYRTARHFYEVAFHDCPLQWMMDREEEVFYSEIFTRVIFKKFREVHTKLKYKQVFTLEFGNEMLEYLYEKDRICHPFRLDDQESFID